MKLEHIAVSTWSSMLPEFSTEAGPLVARLVGELVILDWSEGVFDILCVEELL